MSDLLVQNDIKKGDRVYLPDVAAIIVGDNNIKLEQIYIALEDMTTGQVIKSKDFFNLVEIVDPLIIQKGDSPSKNGVYICYTDDLPGVLTCKLLLTYVDGYWTHTGSIEQYRGVIFGYLGPLPSMFK